MELLHLCIVFLTSWGTPSVLRFNPSQAIPKDLVIPYEGEKLSPPEGAGKFLPATASLTNEGVS